MQEEMRKSLEDGCEPTLEAIIYESVLEKLSGHTKGIGGSQPPMLQHVVYRPVCLRKILAKDKYEKLQMEVINFKEEIVTLKSTILGFQDQLTNITRQLALQQRQEGKLSDN